MLMEEVFERLRQFQDILKERVEIEREIENIPKSLVAQEELLARVKKGYAEKTEQLQAVTARVAELRNELSEAEASRERAEKLMDTISTQREYEALNKEIRDATDKEHQVRKDLQKEERALAEIEESFKRDESMIQLQESEILEKKQKISEETAQKQTRVSELRASEKTATEGIDTEITFKFERIIRSKQGLGIVPVRGYVCSGCSMILPAQFVNEVRQGNRIIFCPYCSRVLHYQEAEESEGDLIADIESGSLADLDDFSDEAEDDSYDEDSEDSEKEMGESDE
ncbi:MAG TPA: C4-type zinc ribbon domain-containing protein [Spirochaetia bacterium]|nr:C4-type zinc ribbon domain-containing protein [Spirochaetales bacterium]HRZ90781.1 C4-type zinc ribbon domain-containing protein [Spirochaetia bacterium]